MARQSSDYEYDVCLSFAGQDREYVDQVASELRDRDIRVFYDKYEEVNLWGKDLYVHLDNIYQNAARYCVIFISHHYRDKLWTNHERQSAQARVFRENQEYLLPARFDDTEIPGLCGTIGYIDLRKNSPAEFAELIGEKIGIPVHGTDSIRQSCIKHEGVVLSQSIEPTAGNFEHEGQVEHVVILIHGIRSRGAWHQKVEQAMGSETVRIVPVRFGWFPALRFLVPWDTSKQPKKQVCRGFLGAKQAYPDAKISVVAHSFGTHILTKILQENLLQGYPDIRIWRVVLCGSVVKQDFYWEHVVNQIGDTNDVDKAKYIVNDCGNKDIWPALGASAGWHYGNAGTDGFSGALVRNRFHEGGHELFFDQDFIKKYWQSFITKGNYIQGEANQGEGIPWYVRCIQEMHLNWLLPLLFLVVLICALVSLRFIVDPPPPDPPLPTYKEFVVRLRAAREHDAAVRELFNELDGRRVCWEGFITAVYGDDDKKAYLFAASEDEIYPYDEQTYASFLNSGNFFSNSDGFDKTVSIGEKKIIEGEVEDIDYQGVHLKKCRFVEAARKTQND